MKVTGGWALLSGAPGGVGGTTALWSPERVEAPGSVSSDTCFLDVQSVNQCSRLFLLVFLGRSPRN